MIFLKILGLVLLGGILLQTMYFIRAKRRLENMRSKLPPIGGGGSSEPEETAVPFTGRKMNTEEPE
jgi:hypothetical protein